MNNCKKQSFILTSYIKKKNILKKKMLQSISGTPAAVLSLTFELINKIEGEMCTSKPSLADERLLGQQPSRCGPVIKA